VTERLRYRARDFKSEYPELNSEKIIKLTRSATFGAIVSLYELQRNIDRMIIDDGIEVPEVINSLVNNKEGINRLYDLLENQGYSGSEILAARDISIGFVKLAKMDRQQAR